MKYVIDRIEDVVKAMRKTGTFTGSKSGDIYTMTSKNTLTEKEWIVIDGTDYKVYDVTDTEFKIETTDTIVDGSYTSLAPYYMYGHRVEISNRLLDKDKDNKYQYQKYPLIALRMPFAVDSNLRPGEYHETKLNIAIMDFTEKDYDTEDRYTNVITPILEPLYQLFLDKIQDSTFIIEHGNYERIDRPFWGIQGSEGNVKYIFNDPLDAIELIDLNIKFQVINC